MGTFSLKQAYFYFDSDPLEIKPVVLERTNLLVVTFSNSLVKKSKINQK